MAFERFTYLFMELVWSLPVIGLLLLRSRWFFWKARKALLVATLVPTFFLSLADSVALHAGIWKLDEEKITGLRLGNVPVEEIIFFIVTNLIIVQSMLLMFALRRRKSQRSRRVPIPGKPEKPGRRL